MVELEGKGLDYERYALRHLFRRLVRQHEIASVLELPAGGEKAMPSLYSLAFAEAGCAVTLVNPVERSLWAWHQLGLPFTTHRGELLATGLPERAYDLVWNFMTLAQHPERDALLGEMSRLSRRLVMVVAVNRFNPGFFSHRSVHRLLGVPWTHGDVAMMNPFTVTRTLRAAGLRVVERGLVDTPPYPDSLGFRDMRLHRLNVDLNSVDWDSRTLGWMASGAYPAKIRLFHLVERLPLPFVVKLLYAHLFFVLAEVP